MMNNKIEIAEAIQSLNPQANHRVEGADLDEATIDWLNGTTPISKADIQAEMDRLQVEYDALDYARKRKAEYPSIEELVVALYDTEDKTAIDEKRAEIKLKYPKP
jgi:serine protease inhibitor